MLLIGVLESVTAQERKEQALIPSFHYGYQWPQGGWADRFGAHFQLGAKLDFQSNNGFLYGIEYAFLFGDQVKEDVLAPFRDDRGAIVTESFVPTLPELKIRGQMVGIHIGKWIRPDDSKSGPLFRVGPAYLRHRIRITDDADPLTFLQGDARKGYDRLSAGWGLLGTVGYRYQSDDGLLNLSIEIQYGRFATRSVRGFQYDLNQFLGDSRDELIAIRAGWIVPIAL